MQGKPDPPLSLWDLVYHCFSQDHPLRLSDSLNLALTSGGLEREN
ncbi:MAG: hypothetical protein AB7W28_03330 [Armatimonadota bacterium]